MTERKSGEFYERLGARLRTLREAAEISQQDAGKALNVTFQQVQKYESGVNRIPILALVRFARLVKMPLSAFLPDCADVFDGSDALGRLTDQAAAGQKALASVRGSLAATNRAVERLRHAMVTPTSEGEANG